MEDLKLLFDWAMSGKGRLVAAAVLMLLMWGLKTIPFVEQKILTTPRRRLAALTFQAMTPAVLLLASGAPPAEIFEAAVTIALGAMGIHATAKALKGGPLVPPKTPGAPGTGNGSRPDAGGDEGSSLASHRASTAYRTAAKRLPNAIPVRVPNAALGIVRMALVAIAMSFLPGCAALQKAMPQIVSWVTDAVLVVEQIESFTDSFFKRHPNPPHEDLVDTALGRTRNALLAAQRASAGAEALSREEVLKAVAAFKEAYDQLLLACAGIPGLRIGGSADSAAPGELVVPDPLLLSAKLTE